MGLHSEKHAAGVMRRHHADDDGGIAQRLFEAIGGDDSGGGGGGWPEEVVFAAGGGMGQSARKSSLTRRALILSQTSGSCAQRQTSWPPRRPRTMAIAVPQAPAPMTAMLLMRHLLWFRQSGSRCRPAGGGCCLCDER